MTKLATVTFESASPYSQSRSYSHEVEKLPKETHDAYEARTWRNKCHTGRDGKVFIPPMAFKMAIDEAAKRNSKQIPGKGKTTYTKFFVCGCLAMDPLILPMTKEETECDRIYANSDGVRGSGKRVWRMFPRIDKWEGNMDFHVLADEITPDVFEEMIQYAGAFVGIGRFRPQSGGYYGRFGIKKVKWN